MAECRLSSPISLHKSPLASISPCPALQPPTAPAALHLGVNRRREVTFRPRRSTNPAKSRQALRGYATTPSFSAVLRREELWGGHTGRVGTPTGLGPQSGRSSGRGCAEGIRLGRVRMGDVQFLQPRGRIRRNNGLTGDPKGIGAGGRILLA
jgi:hypothetical protein